MNIYNHEKRLFLHSSVKLEYLSNLEKYDIVALDTF